MNPASDEYVFQTIAEFEDAMIRGSEVVFEWNGSAYTVFGVAEGYLIGEAYYLKDEKKYNAFSHKLCTDAEGIVYINTEQLLNHCIQGEKLRGIITKAEILDRSL